MTLPKFSRIIDTYKQIEGPLGRWLGHDLHEALGKRLQEKSSQLQPRIMVYGVYNAGKSTLLNALMGRAEAPMADRPETDQITEYPWNGYSLLDTPGIDAPIEHEAVAQDSLDRSDVVLFVVAAGGATDEAATWENLVQIVGRDRRVMLILNDKLGLEFESPEALGVVDKLRTHLERAARTAGIKQILDKVPVHMVDARTALRGREENKPALVAHSGILKLEQALAEFLYESNSGTVFAACRNDLQAAVEQAKGGLEREAGDHAGATLEAAEQQVDIERVRLDDSLNLQLEKLLAEARQNTVTMIGGIVDNEQTQASAAATAEEIVATVEKRLSSHLQAELVQTQRQLKKIGQTLADNQLRSADASLNINFDSTRDQDNPFISPTIKDALGKLTMGSLKDITEKSVLAALELGKDLLPSLFKGIGPKTMGKWAGSVGRWVGPVVQAGVAIHEVYSAFKQEQEQKEALKRREKAIEDAAKNFICELREAYRASLAILIRDIFSPVDEWIAEQKKVLRTQNTEIAHDRQLLEQASLALRLMA